ncbi:MAG TPA: bifunctional DNA primase/polymerase [Acidimicrobiales bacterium]|nr:bifunctional DNA primase/polymerase [Acidimicrobiales bacterium]
MTRLIRPGVGRLHPGQAALVYARQGWAVFPCHHPVQRGCSCGKVDCSSPGKHPRTRRGLHDATTNPEVIRRWWRSWPHANVAVRTGAVDGTAGRGFVVVDVDPPHGGDHSLRALLSSHGPLPDTAVVRTGRGGRHLYFAHPGQAVRNSAGTRLGPGLDVRADGGYVIAPPSRHVSGVAYHWGRARELAPLPGWLIDRLVAPEHKPPPAPDASQLRHDDGVSAWASAALTGELDRIAQAEVGQRNHVLNRAAFVLGQIVGGGHLERSDVVGLLEQAGQAAGLGPRESRATVASGMDAGQRWPRHPTDRPTSARRTPEALDGSGHDTVATGTRPEPVEADGSEFDLRTIELHETGRGVLGAREMPAVVTRDLGFIP